MTENRKIRFRAWDKKRKKFLSPKENSRSVTETGYPYLSFQYIIQQYTGLKDKNNKEIYEGDIVEVTLEDSLGAIAVSVNEETYTETGYVFYNQETCSFRIQLKNYQYCILGGKNLKVVGNVLENPETVPFAQSAKC